MKRLLFLLHMREGPPGLLAEILEAYGISYDSVDVEGEALPDLVASGAVIASGGSPHLYQEGQHSYFKLFYNFLRRGRFIREE